MRKVKILTLLFLLPILVTAQKWSVSGEVFYGTFKMKTMKDFQKEIQANEPAYGFRVVTKFPGYAGYNFLAGYSISSRTSLGVRLQYVSTGGRVDYGDYSGQRTYDQLLHAYSLGINATCLLTELANWQVNFSFTTGAMQTSLENVYRYQQGDVNSASSSEWRSTNYFFNPAFTLNKRFSNHLMLYVSVGYEFQIAPALRSSEDQQQYLKASGGAKDVTAEWDGARIGAGITYRFALSGKDKS
jgi:hypothetical protein